jgi:hypothetical protein
MCALKILVFWDVTLSCFVMLFIKVKNMKYIEVIRQNKNFFVVIRDLMYCDMFWPTWTSSGNTHYVRNTWEEIINIKYYKKK